MRKKALSLALALAMCLGLMAVPASAAGATLTEIISPETEKYLAGRHSDSLIVYSEGIIWNGGGYAGAFDTTGKIIVEPDIYYNGLYSRNFHEGIALVRKDGEIFGMDTNGRELFSLGSGEIDFSRVNSFSDGLCKMYSLSEKAYGYIDKSGKTVLPFEYDEKTGDFHDGLALVYDSANAYWGYMDKTGKLAIPYQFTEAGYFYNGVAPVKLGNRWTLIDTTGKDLLPQQYRFIRDNKDGWIDYVTPVGFLVGKLDDRGYTVEGAFINRAGQVVSDGFSTQMDGFTDGMARVQAKSSGMGKYGFLNENGVLVVPCQYNNAGDFRDGYAVVQAEYNGPCSIIDKAGNVTATFDKDKKPGNAGNGCFAVRSSESGRDRYGFVDYTGKEIVPCKYAEVKDFSGGVAPVSNFENKWGFVNTDGTEIVPCKYSWVFDVTSIDANGQQTKGSGIYRVQDTAGYSYLKSSGWTAPATPSTPTEPTTPTTPSGTQANPTNDKLTSDGVLQNPTVYKIGDSNYFKIRDLAAILNGTEKQFSVGYDNEKQSVTATTGQGYTKLDGDLAGAPAGAETAELSNDTIYVNGQKVEAEVYKIGGNNYFKLRDLGKALNFYVGWSQEQGMFIETDKPYSE